MELIIDTVCLRMLCFRYTYLPHMPQTKFETGWTLTASLLNARIIMISEHSGEGSP